jgi:hypothetical protein
MDPISFLKILKPAYTPEKAYSFKKSSDFWKALGTQSQEIINAVEMQLEKLKSPTLADFDFIANSQFEVFKFNYTVIETNKIYWQKLFSLVFETFELEGMTYNQISETFVKASSSDLQIDFLREEMLELYEDHPHLAGYWSRYDFAKAIKEKRFYPDVQKFIAENHDKDSNWSIDIADIYIENIGCGTVPLIQLI